MSDSVILALGIAAFTVIVLVLVAIILFEIKISRFW